jgi:uncharacterized membrane protein YhhN
MKTKILSLCYFLTTGIFLVLGERDSFYPACLAKAVIIPLLMILFFTNKRSGLTRSDKLIFAALFFSWAGDIILEFSHLQSNMFLPGLISFLTAHIMYFTAFIITPGESVIINKRIYLLIPVLLYGAGLIYYLYDDLAEMRIPVIVYSFVILAMLTGAIDRIEKVNKLSFSLVLTGAVLFVLSDSAIAINKFSYHFEYSSIVIMTTYVIAQYLIVMGYLQQSRSEKK